MVVDPKKMMQRYNIGTMQDATKLYKQGEISQTEHKAIIDFIGRQERKNADIGFVKDTGVQTGKSLLGGATMAGSFFIPNPAASGAVFGAGHAIANDGNIGKEAAIGGATGGVLGKAVNVLSKTPAGQAVGKAVVNSKVGQKVGEVLNKEVNQLIKPQSPNKQVLPPQVKPNPNAVKVYNYETKKLPYTEISPEQAVSELNPKPQYTVNDYINPKTGKTDWTMADDVISQATEPKNMATQELKHGTAIDYEGNISTKKTGTGTDSGWKEEGAYFTNDPSYAEYYAENIPVSSRLEGMENINPKVRGQIADKLLPYNQYKKIPEADFIKLQKDIDYQVKGYEDLLKYKDSLTPEKYAEYKSGYDSWKYIKDNLKQEADVSKLNPRLITSKVPSDNYLINRELPIISQKEDVKALARALYAETGYSNAEIDNLLLNKTGGALYDDLAKHVGSRSKASEIIDALAAKGTTDSQGAETVIFNDRNIKSIGSTPVKPQWIEDVPVNYDNIIDTHLKGLLDGGI